jgi:hypothetical protein
VADLKAANEQFVPEILDQPKRDARTLIDFLALDVTMTEALAIELACKTWGHSLDKQAILRLGHVMRVHKFVVEPVSRNLQASVATR